MAMNKVSNAEDADQRERGRPTKYKPEYAEEVAPAASAARRTLISSRSQPFGRG
jgi:hypothetical protein